AAGLVTCLTFFVRVDDYGIGARDRRREPGEGFGRERDAATQNDEVRSCHASGTAVQGGSRRLFRFRTNDFYGIGRSVGGERGHGGRNQEDLVRSAGLRQYRRKRRFCGRGSIEILNYRNREAGLRQRLRSRHYRLQQLSHGAVEWQSPALLMRQRWQRLI